MKDIQLIENRSEIGAGTRGASLGIDALKIASIAAKSTYFKKFKSLQVKDQNQLIWAENTTPNAIHIDGIVEVYQSTSDLVCNTLQIGKFPIVLAADHASAGGTIAGIKKAFPKDRLGVIWIDAHADLHSPYTSPSGNVHGMPLATALAEDNLGNQKTTPTVRAIEKWSELKSMNGIQPKIEPSDLIFFGVRDTEGPENSIIKEKGIKNYSVAECRDRGLVSVIQEALFHLQQCKFIYISFDVDSMDPEIVSYGTGTPVEEGFSPIEVKQLIEKIISDSKKVVCFEMVEINPVLDNKGNKMAETAFDILENTTHSIIEYGV